MTHQIIRGIIVLGVEQGEGEEYPEYEVQLTVHPPHGTTPQQLGELTARLRRKLDRFYERLFSEEE